MVVLSLFDGISCGQIAFERIGIKIDKYFASEIKPSAIKVTQHHYPNTIQIGDVTKVSYKDGILYSENGVYNVGHIDFLVGGSPCQDFSLLKATSVRGRPQGLNGEKSSLFYHWLRLREEIKPTYWLLENVRMGKQRELELSNFLGVDSLHINSDLVSYQHRDRRYWTNISNVCIPVDRQIDFQDYIDTDVGRCEEAKVNPTKYRLRMWNNGCGNNSIQSCVNVTHKNKVYCVSTKQDRIPNAGLIAYKNFCRFLTRRELEQAQTLPCGYTDILSYNQAQNVIGDGWTVDVIAWILSYAFEEEGKKYRQQFEQE